MSPSTPLKIYRPGGARLAAAEEAVVGRLVEAVQADLVSVLPDPEAPAWPGASKERLCQLLHAPP